MFDVIFLERNFERGENNEINQFFLDRKSRFYFSSEGKCHSLELSTLIYFSLLFYDRWYNWNLTRKRSNFTDFIRRNK